MNTQILPSGEVIDDIKVGEIGTISHGTLIPFDVATTFVEELERLGNESAKKYRAELDEITVGASDDVLPEIVSELEDLLNEHAPDYCYFGAHVGDGSDFGFWPIEDAIEEMKNDDVEVVNDLSEIEPRKVAIVNDHGNLTYGVIDSDGFREVWAIV